MLAVHNPDLTVLYMILRFMYEFVKPRKGTRFGDAKVLAVHHPDLTVLYMILLFMPFLFFCHKFYTQTRICVNLEKGPLPGDPIWASWRGSNLTLL